MVVTSPGPSEGKTTVVSNLGASCAAAGRRVLLVDADLRRPRLHNVFELSKSPGLLEFAAAIQARSVLANHVDRYTQATAVPNLFVMARGSSPPAHSSLQHALRFEEVFSTIRHQFDIVLVDVPPLLCASEVRIMARWADGVILVVRASSTRVDEIVATEKYLRDDGGTLVGTVLNDAQYNANPYYGQYGPTAVRFESNASAGIDAG